MKPVILLVLLLSITFISVTYSQIPQTINYQGVLTDNAGVVVPNDNYTLTFRLYDSNTGGTVLWEESRLVPVNDGLFNIVLGEVVPVDLLFDAQYFLGITINTGAELTPRTKLSSVGYSLNTRSIIDNSITTSKIVDGAVTQDKLHTGCSLPPGGNAGGDLGETYPNPLVTKLQGFNISNTSPQNNQVLKWTGTNWTPATDEVGTVSGTAGGDLSGTFPNPTVSKFLGRTLSTTAPNNGQVLKWDGTYWIPSEDLAGASGTAGGDLSGTYPNPTVVKLQGRNLLTTAPTNGQVIKWNGSNWAPSEDISGGIPSGSAGGDLSGAYPSPTVSKLLGRTLSTTAPTSGQVLSWNGTQWIPITPSSGMGGSGTSNYLPKFTSGSTIGNSVLYENGGKIGIGNTTLQYKLELGNTSEGINHIRINSSTWGGLLFYNGTGDASGAITYGHLTNSLFFYTKPDGGTMTSRMTLDKSGNLGIGINTPSYPLHVSTNRKYAGYFTSDSLDYSIHVLHSEYIGLGYYDASAVYGKSKPIDGFGIGGYFEGGYMGVRGNAIGGIDNYVVGVYGSASGGTINYAVYASGNLAYTGSLINASDKIFKENVNTFPALNKITQLQPRIYNYTSDSRYTHMNLPKGNHYGLIAQELETVFPELVSENVHPSAEEMRGEKGGEEVHYKGVNYMELVPILIQAVKEQQQLINQLTKRIEELEKK